MAQADIPVAQLHHVVKSFGPNAVLRDVSFDLYAGEVHALAGENGAGKSTLIRILAGIHPADSGEVRLDGAAVRLIGPQQARRAGIAVVHQELSLAPNLTVADNIVLGREPHGVAGRLDRRAAAREAREALDRIGANVLPTVRVGALSTGQQQLVEIARALGENPRVLILDEPTAALTELEADRLLGIVEQLRADGLAILYISHRMAEIVRIADRITVLRDGAVADTLTRAELDADRIVTSMVGRPVTALYDHDRTTAHDTQRLVVRGLTDPRVAPADLAVHAGEVVGMAGLIGSGRTELARLIAGAARPTAGTITVDGTVVTPGDLRAALRAGIVMLPESRKEQGLFLQMSIADNVCLGTSAATLPLGRFSRSAAGRAATAFRERIGIRATSTDQKVGELSGGNQQKVLLARCLLQHPKVLILDEPTRGVDVGAKADIYRLINEVAAEGVAVLVISSELPEVLGISDRVLVMREGELVAELTGEDLTEEITMRHATGTHGPASTAPRRAS